MPARSPWRLLLSSAAVLAGACQSQVPPAPIVPGAQSVLLAVDTPGGRQINAQAVGSPAVEVELPAVLGQPGTLTAVYLRWSLAELQLASGPVPLADPELGKTRPLPDPIAAEQVGLDASSPSWESVGELPEWVDFAQLFPLDLDRCVNEGGCLARLEDQDVACTLPCPDALGPTLPEPPAIVAQPPAMPLAPALPVLTPCPAGWTTIVTSTQAPARCDPPRLILGATCPAEEASFYGTPGCSPIGTSCPAGDFPRASDLPAGTGVLYVHAGAAAGGDGSMADPFATIGEANALATPGSVIALAKGSYEEHVELAEGVTLFGACVRDTVVSWVSACCDATLFVTRPGAVIQNLRVRAVNHAINVTAAGQAHVKDVLLEADGGWGLVAENLTQTTAERVVIRGTSVQEALMVDTGARFSGSQLVLDWAGGRPLRVQGSTTRATLSQIAIRDRNGQGMAMAALVHVGAHLDLSQVSIERNFGYGLVVIEAATASVADMTVVGIGATPLDEPIAAIRLESEGHAAITAAALADGPGFQVEVVGAGTRLELSDSVVRDSRVWADPTRLGGVLVEGGQLTLSRASFEHIAGPSVILTGGARAVLRDLIFQRPSVVDGAASDGISMTSTGTQMNLERAFISFAEDSAIHVAEGRATIRDLMLMDRFQPGAVRNGVALRVDTGATLDATRVALLESSGMAIRFEHTAGSTMSHVRIEGRSGVAGADQELYLGASTVLDLSVLSMNGGELWVGAGTQTHLHLSDATLLGGVNAPVQLNILESAQVDAERVFVSTLGANGISAGAGSKVRLVDSQAEAGVAAFQAIEGGSSTLERVALSGGLHSLLVASGSTLEAWDLSATGGSLNGALIEKATVTLHRAHFFLNRGHGMQIRDGSLVQTEDLAVSDTLPGGLNGYGLRIASDSTMRATHFAILRSAQAGLRLDGPDGKAETSEGHISDGPVGLRVYPSADLAPMIVRVTAGGGGIGVER